MSKKTPRPAIQELLQVMARLRAPDGCPWDREQDHHTLKRYAVEEVYELIDAIESGHDADLVDELGDVLLQVVFHAQIAGERGAFDFEQVCRQLVDKLIRRHPHVFGNARADTSQAVWVQWDKIKHAERKNAKRSRASALDGIPRHLPALHHAEKLAKKARRASLLPDRSRRTTPRSKQAMGRLLFNLAAYAQSKGWAPEELLRAEIKRQSRQLRQRESRQKRSPQE